MGSDATARPSVPRRLAVRLNATDRTKPIPTGMVAEAAAQIRVLCKAAWKVESPMSEVQVSSPSNRILGVAVPVGK